MRTISTYRKSGRLFILRVMAMFRHLRRLPNGRVSDSFRFAYNAPVIDTASAVDLPHNDLVSVPRVLAFELGPRMSLRRG